MIPIAPVVKLTDKRVDEIVKKLGHNAIETFYSPILAGLWYFALLLLTTAPFVVAIIWQFFEFQYEYFCYLGVFIVVSYLLNAFLNNNFILTNDKIIIINPNFPFKKQTIINVVDIERIIIDKSKWVRWSCWCLGVFGGNHIEVTTKSGKHLFFCIYV